LPSPPRASRSRRAAGRPALLLSSHTLFLLLSFSAPYSDYHEPSGHFIYYKYEAAPRNTTLYLDALPGLSAAMCEPAAAAGSYQLELSFNAPSPTAPLPWASYTHLLLGSYMAACGSGNESYPAGVADPAAWSVDAAAARVTLRFRPAAASFLTVSNATTPSVSGASAQEYFENYRITFFAGNDTAEVISDEEARTSPVAREISRQISEHRRRAAARRSHRRSLR
jgi:hypothetical protein